MPGVKPDFKQTGSVIVKELAPGANLPQGSQHEVSLIRVPSYSLLKKAAFATLMDSACGGVWGDSIMRVNILTTMLLM